MSDWPASSLGILISQGRASLQTGPFGTALKAAEYSDKGVPLISVREIREGLLAVTEETPRVSPATTRRLPKFVLEEGDIVFGRKGGVDRNAMITAEQSGWFLGSDGIRLRLFSPDLDPSFFAYQMRSPNTRAWLLQNSEGTTMPSLNQKVLARVQITIPEIDVQRRVVTILRGFDDKILINAQINLTLEQIAQAIFKSWFVDFEPVKAKQHVRSLRGNVEQTERAAQAVIAGAVNLNVITTATDLSALDQQLNEALSEKLAHQTDAQHEQLVATASHFPNQLVKSELGLIPEGWAPTTTIESLMELAYGRALKKTDRKPGSYAVFGSGGVIGSHHEFLVDGPGIIVGRKGTVGSLRWEDGPFFPIDTVFYVKTIEKMPLTFAYYLLQTLGLDDMNTDAAVPGLNRNNVYRLNVPNYPATLMASFALIAEGLRNQIRCNGVQAATLSSLRDSLLPKLLSGKIKISGDEIT